MRFITRALSAVLVITVVSMGILPQMVQARAYAAAASQTGSDSSPRLSYPPTPPLVDTELYFSTKESEPENNEIDATLLSEAAIASEQRSMVAADTAALATAYSSDVRDPKIGIDELIAVAPAFPTAGLVLTTAKNTWDSHPQSHEDMLRCVEDESFSDPDWFGASLVDELNQTGNLHGNGEYYVSRYEAFFLALDSSDWSFATDSEGASEIEIDGQVVIGWYGDHAHAGDWSHDGTIALDAGWHRFAYRHEAGAGGSPGAKASFKGPGDADWKPLSASNLTLKPVNLDDGLLLTTKKNTWTSLPENHSELLQCVETDASKEPGWFGSSIVDEINQEENMHGSDSGYTSLYECFFLSQTAGTWVFETSDFGTSEIEIDGQIVASRYGEDTGNQIGTADLDSGWHRFVLRHVSDGGTGLVAPTFKEPGDTDVRPFSISELTLKGTCYLGVDGDSLPSFVEAVLGTHPAFSDTDCDTIDDYTEVKSGLDPLKADSNGDGLNDPVEINGVELDLDGDDIPNAWDADNDNDGVRDGVDISPFSKSGSFDQFDFDIATEGNPLYIDFQIRPENPDHLTISLRDWDWPDDDHLGQIRGVLDLAEDIQIFPVLEMDANYMTEGHELERYGIGVVDGKAQVPLIPLEDGGKIVALQGRMFYPQTAEPLSLTGKLVWNVFSKSEPDCYRITDGDGKCLTLLEDVPGMWGPGFPPEHFGLSYEYPAFTKLSLESWIDDCRQRWQLLDEPGRLLIVNELTGTKLVVDDPGQWQIELIEEGEAMAIAWYPEDFILTGLSVEESYANTAEVGLFYTTEFADTVAAAVVLQQEFLYSQQSITEARDALAGYGLSPFTSVIESYLHFDQIRAAEEELTSQALESMGGAEDELPILWAFQNTSARKGLDDLVSGSYIQGNSYTIDLTEVSEKTLITLRLTWYDTETGESLEAQQILEMLSTSWEWEDEAISTTSQVFLILSNGKTAITGIGGEAIDYENEPSPGWEAVGIADSVVSGIGVTLLDTSTGILGIVGEIGGMIAKEGSRWASVFEFTGGFLNVIGPILIFGGFAIDSAFAIANSMALFEQLGGDEFAGAVALATGIATLLVKGAFAILHMVAWGIVLIPVGGWVIALYIEGILWAIQLTDWISSLIWGEGWMQMIWNEILDVYTDVEELGEIYNIQMYLDGPDIQDLDGNGFDPGDNLVLEPLFTWNKGLLGGNDPQKVYNDLYFEPWMAVHVNKDIATRTVDETAIGPEMRRQQITITPLKSMLNMPLEIGIGCFYRIPYEKCWRFFGEHCTYTTISEIKSPLYSTYYFDVLPSSLGEFIRWREINPLDTDGDGLTDNHEISSGTKPNLRDTDSDGIPDKYEAENGLNPTSADSDGDGLLDGVEIRLGTDPMHTDTDRDGLSDFDEYTGWLIGFEQAGQFFVEHVWGDPIYPDGDLDGLTDLEEFENFNPHSEDSDGDGIPDSADSSLNIAEVLSEDLDGDGLTGQQEIDGWDSQVTYNESTTATEHVASNPMLADTDFDGLNDGLESGAATSPRKPDTDADGLGDLVEITLGTNPAHYDTDYDSLNDGTELTFGSNPLLPDTDADGLTSTYFCNHPFHFLVGLPISEYMVYPLQKLPRGGYLGNLPSLLSFYFVIETPQRPRPFRRMYGCLD